MVIAAVAISAFLQGSVSARLFAIVVSLALGISAFIASALMRQAASAQGARDEARQQAEEARNRQHTAEEAAEAEKRELRSQLASAAQGEQAVSARMQSIVRQVDALIDVQPGELYGPDQNQVNLFVALLEDFDAKRGGNDPVATRLLTDWRDSRSGHTTSAWSSALGMLKTRAVSMGAEEALAG